MTPIFFSLAKSFLGITPPTASLMRSSTHFSLSSAIISSASATCLPRWLLRKMKSTSSCTAAATMLSGVWYSPVYIVSMPASRSRDIRMDSPRTWVSGPALASSILTFRVAFVAVPAIIKLL